MNPPQRILFTNAHLFGLNDDWPIGWLLTEDKRIRLMGSSHAPAFLDGEVTRMIDASHLTMLPGFIDLHVHGACGHEAMDASPRGLQELARFYAQHGVTGSLPKTSTQSHAANNHAHEVTTELTVPVENGARTHLTH